MEENASEMVNNIISYYLPSARSARIPVLCSSRTLIIPLADEAVNECNSVVGIATSKPNTVVTSACEIPPPLVSDHPFHKE